MLLYAYGDANASLSAEDLQHGMFTALQQLGEKRKVLAVPPDHTRPYSRAGELTAQAFSYYGQDLTDVMPALGTHAPMSTEQKKRMYPQVPLELFRDHNWRDDVVTLGEVPASYVNELTEGRVNYPWPAQVNRLLVEGGHDLILSMGQVVPHEVAGMANHNKNIFVGAGGAEGINKSHFIGAAYGMERLMGRADNPVRHVLNYAERAFAQELPIVYALTVVGRDTEGTTHTRGLFIGDGEECFRRAAELAREVNVTVLEQPVDKVVVYLPPDEYKSTWLGNKSIYRTRMAIADGGELIVLAPGVERFGEDQQIDRLIRTYGYAGGEKVQQAVKEHDELQQNLGAAAHLIHGSSERRFTITYCPGELTKEEIEGVNYRYSDLSEMKRSIDPEGLENGFNTLPTGEEVYFIPDPGIGLWAYKERLES